MPDTMTCPSHCDHELACRQYTKEVCCMACQAFCQETKASGLCHTRKLCKPPTSIFLAATSHFLCCMPCFETSATQPCTRSKTSFQQHDQGVRAAVLSIVLGHKQSAGRHFASLHLCDLQALMTVMFHSMRTATML